MDRKRISYLVGRKIHDFRVENDMTQEELALKSNIHPAYFGRIERGEKCPTIDTLYKISNALKIPIEELVNIYDNDTNPNKKALYRIQILLNNLSNDEAIKIVDIIEGIINLKN